MRPNLIEKGTTLHDAYSPLRTPNGEDGILFNDSISNSEENVNENIEQTKIPNARQGDEWIATKRNPGNKYENVSLQRIADKRQGLTRTETDI